MTRILWISSDAHSPCATEVMERSLGYELEVLALPSVLNGKSSDEADVVVVQFPIPGWSPAEALESLRQAGFKQPTIIADPEASTMDAVRLCRLGAFQCPGRSASVEELIDCIELAAVEGRTGRRGEENAEEPWRRMLLGDSRAMRAVHQVVRTVAPKRCTVLIAGETGTGKEMVARAIHAASPRAHLPMVAVNCGALPEHLLESELFGHVKGAFTGAAGNRCGRFEQANRGTIFLDEIGEMSLALQVKLLRVLQEREFQRLGSSETIKVDVRVIAASNADLQNSVRQGTFRADLFYRLNVIPLRMPSLRDRLEDIALLVPHFIQKICRAEGVPTKEIGTETLDRLCEYEWPGNVRELENAVEMALALSEDRPTLYATDFPMICTRARRVLSIAPAEQLDELFPYGARDFDSAVSSFEQDVLFRALSRTKGNKTHAANLLGMKRTTLIAKLRGGDTAMRSA